MKTQIKLIFPIVTGALVAFPFMSACSSHAYKIHKIVRVAGCQGVASTKNYYYNSNNDTIHRYNLNWEHNSEIDNIYQYFQDPQANHHIGDLEVYNGKIYAVGENFDGTKGTNIKMGIFNANTLVFETTEDLYPDEHGLCEISGVTVVPKTNSIWVSSWYDGPDSDSGHYLYEYSLSDYSFKRKVETKPYAKRIQGIKYYDGYIWATCDDGSNKKDDGDTVDHLYRIDVSNQTSQSAPAKLVHTFEELPHTNELEGITFDYNTKEMMVMQNISGGMVYIYNKF
ncbi:MAG: hypothetical protein LBM72_00470 [Mycoplasmataceae bacterium]|nr:hypothetical protein [Mycoplasmataceae bacterium]